MIHKELETLLAPVVEDLGCELWACEYIVQGKHSLLRVYIDKTEGVHINDCERVSREISTLLDVQSPITSNYTLEVSSPGIDRPLFTENHFKRYLNSEVMVKIRIPLEKRRKFSGKLIDVRDNKIIIAEEGKEYPIPLGDIVKANLIV